MLESADRGDDVLAVGKVPPDVLGRVLTLPRGLGEFVVVGPALGEDGAVVRVEGDQVVVAADPVTFQTSCPGHVSVCVNANDVAVMGARPEWFTTVLLFPEGTREAELTAVMADALATADALGIVLVGGHTEITPTVSVPVISLTMFGRLVGPGPVCTGGAQAGDALIQVGAMAVEGTAILAGTFPEALGRVLDATSLGRARGFLRDPGICVVEAALCALENGEIHSMHDPTEGGVATGVREMCRASGLGVAIAEAALVVDPITVKVCQAVECDPLGLISSGCLLVACPAAGADRLVGALRQEGHRAARVGTFTVDRAEITRTTGGATRALPVFEVDEIARVG